MILLYKKKDFFMLETRKSFYELVVNFILLRFFINFDIKYLMRLETNT